MSEKTMGEFSSFEKAIAAIADGHPGITYNVPWWGDKETESGNLSNRGYVIGFRAPDAKAQWRLDYDEVKRLHINWSQELKVETLKECYQISSIRPQDTQWDYYISWTAPRVDDIPPDIKERLDKVGGVKKWSGKSWVGSSL